MIEGELQIQFSGFSLDTGSFKIRDKEITIIYGDSGSGKSTFLNCLSGVETRYSGQITFSRSIIIGYVFQKNSLFPHLNVRDNLNYALKRCKSSNHSFDQIIDSLSVRPLLEKSVSDLSGGQIQRVAIARTLLSSPDLILMDEPLSALDSKAKEEIIQLLKVINQKFEIPFLIVTHSKKETISLCDRVLRLREGSPVEELSREEVLLKIDPKGPINHIPKECVQELNITSDFIVHSSNISVIKSEGSEQFYSNSISCELVDILEFDAASLLLKLRYLDKHFLYSKISRNTHANLSVTNGDRVVALFGPDSHIL